MRISDWSSDVCSSDREQECGVRCAEEVEIAQHRFRACRRVMPPDALRFEKADRGVDLPLAKRPLVAGSGVDLVSGWHARRHGLGQRRTETNERRPRGDMEGPGLGIATRWCGRGDRDRALDQRAVYRPGKKGP